MSILVDSSVWISYFRSGQSAEKLNQMIDENLICINKLILAELIPFLKIKKQDKLINLLNNILKYPLNIEWDEIIKFQTVCLKNGINKIGLPDLIIIQNVRQNKLKLFSLDKHFNLIKKIIPFNMV